MKRWLLVVSLLTTGIISTAVCAMNEQMIDNFKGDPHAKWLATCMAEIGNIQARPTTRKELLKHFVSDGIKRKSKNFPNTLDERFALRRCPLIKCDVIFYDENLGDRCKTWAVCPAYLDCPKSGNQFIAPVVQGQSVDDQEQSKWLLERFKEVKSIKPGMQISDLRRSFVTDLGGFGFEPDLDWALKSCELIQLHVTMDRKGKDKTSWRILTVGAPRLDGLYSD